MTSTTNGSMIPLTQDQLQVINEMAELFYTFEHICINAELDPESYIEDFNNKAGDFYIAYVTGYLKGDMTLRKSIKTSADNGSHPAQQLLLKIQEETNIQIKANE